MSLVTLSWAAARWKAGPRVERYQILRENDAGNFVLIGTLNLEYSFTMELLGPPLTFTDSDVVEGETYRYKVLAVAYNGRSLRSNIIEVVASDYYILQEDAFLITLEDDSGSALLEVAP